MNNDTVKLLRECNAGIKMGKSAIEAVLPHARDVEMRRSLEICKSTHSKLGDEAHEMLLRHEAPTKDPHPIAKTMSDMKIYTRMMLKNSDKTIADVMTDGCDMGIKSIHKFMNKYSEADEKAKSIAKRLVASEEYLELKMREFL
jgi:hypothetical protein